MTYAKADRKINLQIIRTTINPLTAKIWSFYGPGPLGRHLGDPRPMHQGAA